MINICNGCTACCTALKINDTFWGPEGKPAGKPCEKISEVGCSIHEDESRPYICGSYSCFWRQFKIKKGCSEEWRPDKLGIIVSPAHDKEKNTFYFKVEEVREGALVLDNSKTELIELLKLVFSLSKDQVAPGAVVVRRFGEDDWHKLNQS